MSVRYSDDFKKEVIRAYMAGDKSTVEIAAEYNIAKSSVSEWAKKYGEECQYTHTTSK
ncbi:MAG: helix-turn-helix domain containing protein [Clostridiales bacterium]|nr:helix-turn-helix domain containing protein [Clostridiales bacterium]